MASGIEWPVGMILVSYLKEGPEMVLDELLRSIVDALLPTELGVPKTQAVIDGHIEAIEAILERGLTYKQIAQGLNDRGARGRTGAEFTEQSLYTSVRRARKRRGRPRAAETSPGAVPPTDFAPSLATPSSKRQNSPLSPELDRFRQRIDQARTHAAADEFLFRRGGTR